MATPRAQRPLPFKSTTQQKTLDRAVRGAIVTDTFAAKSSVSQDYDDRPKVYQVRHHTYAGPVVKTVGVEGRWYSCKGIKTFWCEDKACATCDQPDPDSFVASPSEQANYFSKVPNPASQGRITLQPAEATSLRVAQCSGVFDDIVYRPPFTAFDEGYKWLSEAAREYQVIDDRSGNTYGPENDATPPLAEYAFQETHNGELKGFTTAPGNLMSQNPTAFMLANLSFDKAFVPALGDLSVSVEERAHRRSASHLLQQTLKDAMERRAELAMTPRAVQKAKSLQDQKQKKVRGWRRKKTTFAEERITRGDY
ncbi:hypothetical protein MBLNU230_g4329t1 [Neophaeotheca triangularis]